MGINKLQNSYNFWHFAFYDFNCGEINAFIVFHLGHNLPILHSHRHHQSKEHPFSSKSKARTLALKKQSLCTIHKRHTPLHSNEHVLHISNKNMHMHLESTGALIGSTHPSLICMDAPSGCGRGCTHFHDWFFFFFFFRFSPKQAPNRSDMDRNKCLKKNLLKKRKFFCQNTPFWHPSLKKKTLNSSQTLSNSLILSISSLSLSNPTIALKLVYVYHYMNKYA